VPDPDQPLVPPGLPVEEEQESPDGPLAGRRRPDGPVIDEVGDPVPVDRGPHTRQ
jgi:hypothetical protein